MAVGSVKWFNNAKGFGFIVCEEHDEDLFAHFSAIQMDGYRTLKTGQMVEFDTVKANNGIHAVNIRPLEAMLDVAHSDDVVVEIKT